MSADADDAAFCAALVREQDFQRYAASLFTSPTNRRALLALAAFGIEIARIADQVTQPLAGEIRLQWWTDALQGNEHGGAAGNPVAAELLRAISDFALQVEPLTRLIEARRFDLYSDPMPNRAALEIYLDDVQGTLFAQAARILGDAHAEAARDAGLARGLNDMLTRLPRDAARGRCFLPLDENDAAELFEGRDTPALHAARDEWIAAARDALQRVRAKFKSSATRPAWLPLATLARELEQLQQSGPLTPPAPPSRLRVLTSQWWMAR